MTLPYVCPRCTGELESGDAALYCAACKLTYPVRDGVPYLVAYGQDWYLKLREVLLYRDFCRKVKSGAIERDRLAPHEDTSAVIFENLVTYFDQACSRIDFSKNPKILDVGAGCGEVAHKLTELGADVYAIDLNMYDLHYDVRWMTFNLPTDLSFSERLTGQPIPDPAFHRAIADGDNIPFPDSSFDCVVLRAVAHHLFDLNQFMREASRVLRPNGQLLLISEPLASIIDDPAEYQQGDLDYEEGMHETRPYFRRYHKALRAAGFHDIQVQCYFICFGHRINRLQQRLKIGFDLNRRLSTRLVKGRIARLLDFTAGCMNLYAIKSGVKRQLKPAIIPTDVPAIPMSDLLVSLPDAPSNAAAAVRDYLPARHHTTHLDLTANAINRMVVRGVRGAETVEGTTARYLLTAAVFYIKNNGPSTRLSISYNATAAKTHTPSPKFFLNGTEYPLLLAYDGWQKISLPLEKIKSPVVELCIMQPGLLNAQPARSDGRDVGLAIAEIWVEPADS